MKQRSALYATLTHTLGLPSRDLAEIGGFSERFARDLLAGRRPFPADVQEAIDAIQEDIDAMVDAFISWALNVDGAILVPGNTDQARQIFPDMPGRGYAGGVFVGPARIAALAAWGKLRDRGFVKDILFIPE